MKAELNKKMLETTIETFCPSSRQEWRQWLLENHETKTSIWLVYYKKKTNKPSLTWSDAVDEALCFGWIDSTKKTLDKDSFMQFFCKRKPTSIWSKINKGKVQNLIEEGHMTKAGYKSIEVAKQNGSWALLDEVEELSIPDDLEVAFQNNAGSKDYFLSLSKSVKKMMLYWILSAKQAATRQKRIDEIATLAALKQKPKQF